MGGVEEAGLQQQDKGDPLVVGLVLHLYQGFVGVQICVHNLIIPCIVLSHPWVRGEISLLRELPGEWKDGGGERVPWQREGAHDVAVGVHHMSWNRPVVRNSCLMLM